MKLVTIPIQEIDSGITYCLFNARRINQIAHILWERNPREYSDEYIAVMYYYAVEEFGKALHLKSLKESSKNETHVKAKLYDHNLKMEEALKHNPNLIIRKLVKTPHKFPPKPKNDEVFILHDSAVWTLSNYNIVDGFFERSSMWLIDYDEKLMKWNDSDRELLDTYEIHEKINLLDSEIEKLQTIYNSKS